MRDLVLNEYKIDKIIDILSFSSMYIYVFNNGYVGKTESHKQYEFIYVIEGTEIVYDNGNEYVLEKGQAFLHKPYMAHSDKPKSQYAKVFIFSFTCISKNIEILSNKILTLTEDENYYITQIFDEASKYFRPAECYIFYSGKNDNRPQYNIPLGIGQIIKNKLELLFIDMISQSQKRSDEKGSKIYEDRLTERIINKLSDHLCEKFSLNIIAGELNYSKNYLCRHFKKITNVSINQYFNQLKIDEAKKLLAKTNDSIEDISDKLAFTNVQYFSLMFKRAVGFTPSKWRKNAKNNMFY